MWKLKATLTDNSVHSRIFMENEETGETVDIPTQHFKIEAGIHDITRAELVVLVDEIELDLEATNVDVIAKTFARCDCES